MTNTNFFFILQRASNCHWGQKRCTFAQRSWKKYPASTRGICRWRGCRILISFNQIKKLTILDLGHHGHHGQSGHGHGVHHHGKRSAEVKYCAEIWILIEIPDWCLLCCLWLLSLCLRSRSGIWPLRSPLWETSSWGMFWTMKIHSMYNSTKHLFRMTLITDTDMVTGMGMVMATMVEIENLQLRIGN